MVVRRHSWTETFLLNKPTGQRQILQPSRDSCLKSDEFLGPGLPLESQIFLLSKFYVCPFIGLLLLHLIWVVSRKALGALLSPLKHACCLWTRLWHHLGGTGNKKPHTFARSVCLFCQLQAEPIFALFYLIFFHAAPKMMNYSPLIGASCCKITLQKLRRGRWSRLYSCVLLVWKVRVPSRVSNKCDLSFCQIYWQFSRVVFVFARGKRFSRSFNLC